VDRQTRVRARELFGLVRDLPADQRDHAFQQLPAHDRELRAYVEEMLASLADAGDFLRDVSAAPLLPPRPDRIGPYFLREPIGEGGFGTVYLAEQEHPVRRRVALKVIKLGMDTRQVIARFEAERQALALMDHPAIARVLDAGATPDARPFFVMELVRGIPITSFCDQHRLDVPQRLHLFRLVCEGVQHAHQRGVIHRDLKPANILVAPADNPAAPPVPKIIDFGIAKAIHQPLTDRTIVTEQRQLIGTPEYMSPEQAVGGGGHADIDTRADVYSLGVVLYELLTGVTPLEGPALRSAEFARLQRMIAESEPPRPSTRVRLLADTPDAPPAAADAPARRRTDRRTLAHRLRGDLDWIVMRAIEKDRARRYPTALSLAEDIQRHLDHQPVLAGPPSRIYRLRRTLRRNRTAAVAAAAVLCAILAGLVASTAGFMSARYERDEAQRLRDGAERVAYTASLYAAARAIEKADGAGARRALTLAPEHLRSWEWRHLLRRSDPSTATWRPVPPGRPRVWPGPDPDHALLWHPDTDPALIDLRTGAPVLSFPRPPGPDTLADLSPDASLLLVCTRDAARVYRTDAATPLWERHDTLRFAPGAFSADGLSLAALDPASGKLLLLDARTGLATRSITPDAAPRAAPQFADRGRQLRFLVGSPGGRMFMAELDLASSRATTAFESTSRDPRRFIFSTAGTPDELRVTLFEPAAPRVVPLQTPRSAAIADVDLAPDASLLVAADTTGSIRLWRAASDRRFTPATPLVGHAREVTSVAVTPDATRLLSVDADGYLKLWDASAAGDLPAWPRDRTSFTDAVSPDARFTFGGAWGYAMLADARAGTRRWSRALSRAYLVASAFTPDASTIACADTGGAIFFLRTADGADLRAPLSTAPVSALAFLDDTRLLAACTDATLRVLDTRAAAESARIDGPAARVSQLVVTPDARTAFTATGHRRDDAIPSPTTADDAFADAWDLVSHTRAQRLGPHPAAVTALALSPDGASLFTGCADGSLHRWNLAADARWSLAWSAAPTAEEVSSIALAPTLGRVAACLDSAVAIADADSGVQLIQLATLPGAARAARFTADARSLVLVTPGHDFQLLESAPPPAAAGDRAVSLTAWRLLETLLREQPLREDALSHLAQDPAPAAPAVLDAARALAQNRADPANYLNSDATQTGIDRASGPDLARRAARTMQAVCRQHPDVDAFQNTLALACYRAGQHADALDAAQRAADMRGARNLPLRPSDLLIRVLARAALDGTIDRDALDLAIAEIDRQHLRGDYETDHLLAEALERAGR
jgi:serine/threonine protein kinase/WD40 repeat protein